MIVRCLRACAIRPPAATTTAAAVTALRTPAAALHHSAPLRAPSDVPPALAKDLHAIINNDRLVLFLTGTPQQPQCSFTWQMVDLMDQLGVKYGYFNILSDEEVCEGLKKYSDWPTYPQVYLNGELLGGYDICKQMMLDGSFPKLLKEHKLL